MDMAKEEAVAVEEAATLREAAKAEITKTVVREEAVEEASVASDVGDVAALEEVAEISMVNRDHKEKGKLLTRIPTTESTS